LAIVAAPRLAAAQPANCRKNSIVLTEHPTLVGSD
jgi:hypothetical protein